MNCNNTLSYFVISLENEQLFIKNTKILKIVLFSLINNKMRLERNPTVQLITSSLLRGGGGGSLGLFRWGCATGTLEPLAYSRASSSEFCYPIIIITLI